MTPREPISDATGGEKPVYHTTGILLLRILHELEKRNHPTTKLGELVDKVLLAQIGRKFGLRIYDLAYSDDGQVKSLGLLQDIGALSAAGLIRLRGDDVLVSLTDEGRTLAASTGVSETYERVLPQLQIEP